MTSNDFIAHLNSYRSSKLNKDAETGIAMTLNKHTELFIGKVWATLEVELNEPSAKANWFAMREVRSAISRVLNEDVTSKEGQMERCGKCRNTGQILIYGSAAPVTVMENGVEVTEPHGWWEWEIRPLSDFVYALSFGCDCGRSFPKFMLRANYESMANFMHYYGRWLKHTDKQGNVTRRHLQAENCCIRKLWLEAGRDSDQYQAYKRRADKYEYPTDEELMA